MLRLVDYDSNEEDDGESKEEETQTVHATIHRTGPQSSEKQSLSSENAAVVGSLDKKISMALSVCSAPDVVPIVSRNFHLLNLII